MMMSNQRVRCFTFANPCSILFNLMFCTPPTKVGILRRCYAGLIDDADHLAIDRCFKFEEMGVRRRNRALNRIEHVWRRYVFVCA